MRLGIQSLPDGAFPSPANKNPFHRDIADAWTSEDANYGLVPVSNNCDYSLCETADDQTFRSPTSDRDSWGDWSPALMPSMESVLRNELDS